MNSIIKLTSGETIIAEIIHEDETITSVLEPIALEIGESESGKPMMVALSWIPLVKKVNMINLKTNHVVAKAEVDEDIDAYYKKSLAILKGDVDKLREILEEETEADTLEAISDDEEIDDPWVNKFGQPLEIKSANTVH